MLCFNRMYSTHLNNNVKRYVLNVLLYLHYVKYHSVQNTIYELLILQQTEYYYFDSMVGVLCSMYVFLIFSYILNLIISRVQKIVFHISFFTFNVRCQENTYKYIDVRI